jgi:pimeloyl-ACP methyl ester carboxylesterase
VAFSCVWNYLALTVAARRPDLVRALVVVQAPRWSEEVAWAERIDRRGVIRTPVLGQAVMAAGSRLVARRWYRAALPRGYPAHRSAAFAVPADQALRAGAVFCLASLTQAWFAGAAPDLVPVDLPAVVLWGGADRTHRHSSPGSASVYLPSGRSWSTPTPATSRSWRNPARLREALDLVGWG